MATGSPPPATSPSSTAGTTKQQQKEGTPPPSNTSPPSAPASETGGRPSTTEKSGGGDQEHRHTDEERSEGEGGSSYGDDSGSVKGVNGSITGMRRGKCKWFNVAKGWGFITPSDGGQDVFVHQSVIHMDGFRSLGDDEEIEFECKVSGKGLEATSVQGISGDSCKGSHRRPMSKKKFRRLRCYNCGEFANHIASKCQLGPQPKKCHHCKGEDHLIADCPNRKPGSRPKSSASSNAESSTSSANNGGPNAAPNGSGTSPDPKKAGVVVTVSGGAAPTAADETPKQNEKAA